MKLTLTTNVVAFAVVIFASLIIVTGLNLKHDLEGAIAAKHISVRHQSQTFAEHAARSFEAVDLILLRVVEQVERDINEMPRSAQDVQDSLQKMVDLTPQIRALVLADANGIETASNTGQGIGVDLSDRGYFKAHNANPTLGLLVDKPLQGRVTGRWFLSVSRRINDHDGNFAGVAIAIVSQDYFNAFYQSAENTDRISTALINGEGLIFSFSQDFHPKGTDVSGVSMKQEPLFTQHMGPHNDTSYEGTLFLSDVTRITSHSRIENYPVFIVSSVPRDHAFKEMVPHLTTIAWTVAITVLVLGIMLVFTIRHVRQREQLEDKLFHMANHDLLTNLPNRNQGIEYLARAVAAARRHVTQVGVLFVDLDGFKEVNDTLGHEAGDLVLVEVSARFQACVRETDIVARLGGDEFLVILTDVTDNSAVIGVAEKLLKTASEPFELYGKQATLGASIGISLYPHNGDGPDVLVKVADAAMYQAKASGKNTYQLSI